MFWCWNSSCQFSLPYECLWAAWGTYSIPRYWPCLSVKSYVPSCRPSLYTCGAVQPRAIWYYITGLYWWQTPFRYVPWSQWTDPLCCYVWTGPQYRTSCQSPAPEVITQVTDADPPTGPASAVLLVPYPVSDARYPDRWLPVSPTEIPFEPIQENVRRLKQYRLDAFEGSTFNTEGKFSKLHGPDGHIHLQSNAVPKARHSPIPVAFCLKEATNASLFRNVECGIVAPVPVGIPTEWCSTMVVTGKKDGRPRRTIYYQHLNSQCLCETHHTGSPFHLALQLPLASKNTALDSVDGYHSMPVDVKSEH